MMNEQIRRRTFNVLKQLHSGVITTISKETGKVRQTISSYFKCQLDTLPENAEPIFASAIRIMKEQRANRPYLDETLRAEIDAIIQETANPMAESKERNL